ncbi:MAG: L-ribulose-5-phosphate 4-epimerase AraD [Sodalis sp.]|uniref:class II aldolase/adducin family protein n=1 Tax=Sodalis sp. (in: enterobacteria) TaxID=1898979 RepID=UPI0038738FB8|nr:MAG: L-ribulose-5-phosphate 4-epimerase AraD [Sodalis sp.]
MVNYNMTLESMVVVGLVSARWAEGRSKPSSDSDIHRAIYLAFECVGWLIHTHFFQHTILALAV